MDEIVNPLLLKVKKASPMYILGQDANIVEDYEYLGVLITRPTQTLFTNEGGSLHPSLCAAE